MNKLGYISAVLIIINVLQSCKDFLDIEPITSTTAGAFETINDCEAALISGYNTLYSEYYTWDNILLGDVRSDNCYAGPPDDVEIFSYDMLTINPNTLRVFDNWQILYNGISRVNYVLKIVNEIDVKNEERKSEIIGEARFLRAFFYFDIVKLYGGVPIIDEAIEENESNPYVERKTVQEVYDFIIDDLETAISLLPESFQNDKGRATKGAACAVLAKVWAHCPQQNYDKTIQYCNAVINSQVNYELLNDYSLLFDGNNYNNSESIFEIQYIQGTEYGNWGPQLFLPPSITQDGWRKYGTPSVDLVNEFKIENDTVRLNASVIWERVNWVDEYWSPLANENEIPFIFKQKHAVAWSSGDHFYILRLADIILLKAEAMAKLGYGDKGRSLLNQIRNRVLLPDVNVDDADLLSAILRERRLELAFESHRWDDLVRNNLAVETMKNLKEYNLITQEFVYYNMSSHKLILPIPQQEINRNLNLEQNPGYN